VTHQDRRGRPERRSSDYRVRQRADETRGEIAISRIGVNTARLEKKGSGRGEEIGGAERVGRREIGHEGRGKRRGPERIMKVSSKVNERGARSVDLDPSGRRLRTRIRSGIAPESRARSHLLRPFGGRGVLGGSRKRDLVGCRSRTRALQPPIRHCADRQSALLDRGAMAGTEV